MTFPAPSHSGPGNKWVGSTENSLHALLLFSRMGRAAGTAEKLKVSTLQKSAEPEEKEKEAFTKPLAEETSPSSLHSAGGETEAGVGEIICQPSPSREMHPGIGVLGQHWAKRGVSTKFLPLPQVLSALRLGWINVHCALCTKQKWKW